jgi:hypothetical protein
MQGHGLRGGMVKNGSIAGGIVVIDQAPIRRSLAAECTAIMERLEQARIGWHRYEREDRPAFIRWRAREFGALLSEGREVEDRIRDAQALVHEVEMEMRRRFQDPYAAYQRVMFRRANPAAAQTDLPEPESSKPGATRPLTDFEKEALFQEWVHKFLGTSPDKLDDNVYSSTFEMFKAHMFVSPRDESPFGSKSQPNSFPNSDARSRASREGFEEEPADELDSDRDVRVKQLYRTLVRRLHPDLRADGSAQVSTLWHEVQEAYAANDVAHMEILLALCDIQTNELGEGTSLSQMRTVLAELDRSFRALNKMLLEAEGEDAWNFARSGPSDQLRLSVERQLKSDLAIRKNRLEVFTRTIAEWQKPPMSVRRVMRL